MTLGQKAITALIGLGALFVSLFLGISEPASVFGASAAMIFLASDFIRSNVGK